METVFLIILIIIGIVFIIKKCRTLTTVWCRNKVCLVGKTVIVTGANTGIGYQVALDFAKRGAKLILACRSEERAKEARLKIINETENQNVLVKLVDLCSFTSVRAFAKSINETEDRLDILVNNAGVLEFTKNTYTSDGYPLVMQVNYLSPFLLTHLLMGLLKKTSRSRIVNVSSLVSKYNNNFDVDKVFDKSRTVHYPYSKICFVLFTIELAKRLKQLGISVYSAEPGIADTEIFRCESKFVMKAARIFGKLFLKSSEEGAQTIIYCATEKGIEKYSGQNFVECQVINRFKNNMSSEFSKNYGTLRKKNLS